VEDAQIAAIALTHRMQLATRNTTDFELIDGLEIVNPWSDDT
jgi:predicted nucleic acid-binding protein